MVQFVLTHDVVPNRFPGLLTLGCSFGSFDFSGMATMLDNAGHRIQKKRRGYMVRDLDFFLF